jgi:hypothetical protein
MTQRRFVPARNLPGLRELMDEYRHLPVLTLRQALLELGLLDAMTLDAIATQDPELLRGGHAGLITRVLVTADELGHALARAAGLPEVDVARFDIQADAFRRLPLDTARHHAVVPLGAVQEVFYVACGTPTNEDLRHYLCSVTGCTVIMVWASEQSIQNRLDLQDRHVNGHPDVVSTLPWTITSASRAAE